MLEWHAYASVVFTFTREVSSLVAYFYDVPSDNIRSVNDVGK